MRIRKKEKQFKEVEITLEDYNECDKCKTRIYREPFSAFNCEVILTNGDSYPEYYDATHRTVDLCKSCAEDLMKLLETNGYRVNTQEEY